MALQRFYVFVHGALRNKWIDPANMFDTLPKEVQEEMNKKSAEDFQAMRKEVEAEEIRQKTEGLKVPPPYQPKPAKEELPPEPPTPVMLAAKEVELPRVKRQYTRRKKAGKK